MPSSHIPATKPLCECQFTQIIYLFVTTLNCFGLLHCFSTEQTDAKKNSCQCRMLLQRCMYLTKLGYFLHAPVVIFTYSMVSWFGDRIILCCFVFFVVIVFLCAVIIYVSISILSLWLVCGYIWRIFGNNNNKRSMNLDKRQCQV